MSSVLASRAFGALSVLCSGSHGRIQHAAVYPERVQSHRRQGESFTAVRSGKAVSQSNTREETPESRQIRSVFLQAQVFLTSGDVLIHCISLHRTDSPKPSDSSSSPIGQNKEFQSQARVSLISLDRCIKPRSSLVRTDQLQSTAGALRSSHSVFRDEREEQISV